MQWVRLALVLVVIAAMFVAPAVAQSTPTPAEAQKMKVSIKSFDGLVFANFWNPDKSDLKVTATVFDIPSGGGYLSFVLTEGKCEELGKVLKIKGDIGFGSIGGKVDVEHEFDGKDLASGLYCVRMHFDSTEVGQMIPSISGMDKRTISVAKGVYMGDKKFTGAPCGSFKCANPGPEDVRKNGYKTETSRCFLPYNGDACTKLGTYHPVKPVTTPASSVGPFPIPSRTIDIQKIWVDTECTETKKIDVSLCQDFQIKPSAISDLKVDPGATEVEFSFKTDAPSYGRVIIFKDVEESAAEETTKETWERAFGVKLGGTKPVMVVDAAYSNRVGTDHRLKVYDLTAETKYSYIVSGEGEIFQVASPGGGTEAMRADVSARSGEVETLKTPKPKVDTKPPEIVGELVADASVDRVGVKGKAFIIFTTSEPAAHRIEGTYATAKTDELLTEHYEEMMGFPGGKSTFQLTLTDAAGNKKEMPIDIDFPADDAAPEMQGSFALSHPYGIAAGLKQTVESVWADDVVVDKASVYVCHGTKDKCTAENEFKSSEARVGDTDEVGGLQVVKAEINTEGFIGGETVKYYFEVCDDASLFGGGEDKCTESMRGSFEIIDSTPPAIRAVKAELSEKNKVTFTAEDITDVKGLDYATLIVDGEEAGFNVLAEVTETGWTTYPTRSGKTVFEYSVPPEKQGGTLKWSVRAVDSDGNSADKNGKDISVPDETKPTIYGHLDKTAVRVGEKLKFTITATDNRNVTKFWVKIGTKELVYKLSGEPGKQITEVVTITATEEQYKKDVTVTASVADDALNKAEISKSYNVFAPECKDTAPPKVLTPPSGPPKVRPGDGAMIRVKLSDTVNQFGCGGLAYANLEVAGVDGKFRFAGYAGLGEAADAKKSTEGKVTEASAVFNYTVDDFSRPRLLKLIAPKSVERGLGGKLGGRAFGAGAGLSVGGGLRGLTGAVIAQPQGSLSGLLKAVMDLLKPTGKVTEPAEQIYVPIGTPGTTVTWKITAYDENGNQFTVDTGTFSVEDTEAPVAAGSFGTWTAGEEIDLVAKEEQTITVDDISIPAKLWGAGSDSGGFNINGTYKSMWKGGIADYGTFALQFVEGETGPPSTAKIRVLKPAAKMPLGEEVLVTGCFKDYGILSKLDLQSAAGGATGTFRSVEAVDVAAAAGGVKCHTWSWTPAARIGSTLDWRIEATDSVGNKAANDAVNFAVTSKVPFLVSKDWAPKRPVGNQEVAVSVHITDDNGLTSAAIETDELGTFEKVAEETFENSLEEKTTIRWRAPKASAGTVIKWKLIAVDADGNSVVLDPEITIVEDTENPEVEASVQGEPEADKDVVFKVKASDAAGIESVSLEVKEGERWSVKKVESFSADSVDTELVWTDTGLQPGQKVFWRVTATDANGNSGTTSEESFIVKQQVIITEPVCGDGVCEAGEEDCLADCKVPPPPQGCDTTKPGDLTGACMDGKQTVTTWDCDTETGKWTPSETEQDCKGEKEGEASQLPIIIVVGAVAAAAVIILFLKMRKTQPAAAPSPVAVVAALGLIGFAALSQSSPTGAVTATGSSPIGFGLAGLAIAAFLIFRMRSALGRRKRRMK